MKSVISRLFNPAVTIRFPSLLRYYPYAILLLSFGLTLHLWHLYDKSLKTGARAVYAEKTGEISAKIIKRMHDNEQVLRGAAGLVNVNNAISREAWRRYVSTLKLEESYPGIYGVGFSKWLTPSQREGNIRDIQAEGFPGYTIRPDGERAVYTSIIYLEPFNWRNQRAFGYDMYSEPIRRRAMERARVSGATTVAAKVLLLQETDKDVQSGMLMYVPVYRQGLPTETEEQRRDAILGFTYSPVRIGSFIDSSVGMLPDDITIEFLTADEGKPEDLLFGNSTGNELTSSRYRSVSHFTLYGRDWTLSFKARPFFLKEEHRDASMVALVGGLIASTLLTLVAFMIRATHRKALKVVRATVEGEARFKGAFEQSAVGMALVLPSGVWIKANDRLCAMLGYDEAELSVKGFQELTHPDDLAEDLEYARRLLAGEIESFTIEKRYIHKQGAIVWVLLAAVLVRDEKGAPLYFVAQILDITERKRVQESLRESEERFSTAFNRAPMMFTISNLEDGKYLDVNQCFLDVSGFSRDEVIGRTSVELGWLAEGERKQLKDQMIKDGHIHNREMLLKAKAGTTILCKYWGEMTTLSGKPCLFSIALDITEQRKMEEMYLQAQKLDTVGRMVGGVAHEFNNALYCVLGFSELLLSKLDAQSPFRYDVEHIHNAGRQAADVTRQLLAYSRKQTFRLRSMELDGLIVNLQKMLARLLGEDVRIQLDLQAGAVLATVDPTQVQQVLINLCINARDAMPEGGVLLIRSQVAKAPPSVESLGIRVGSSFIKVSVKDQGVGMAPEILSRIFDPFFTTKDVGKGTGLGLSVVQGIVKQHGGWIDISSCPGKGTCFDVYLPCAETDDAPLIQDQDPLPRGNGELVLVVEDEAMVRHITSRRLRLLGYRVIEADSLEDGWRRYCESEEPVRLLLSDVVLPEGNGVLLAERISARDPSVSIILTSGYSDEGSRIQEITVRKWSFLQKPYSGSDLAQRLHDLLSLTASA